MIGKPEETIHLHFNDLKLLMENYQNVVQLNTLLLEQQKQIIELQKELARNQLNVSDSQSKIYSKVENIIKDLDSQTNRFMQTNNLVTNLDAALHKRFDSAIDKVEETKSSVGSMTLEMNKQHSGLINKIYVALVGSALIIISLIGLVTTIIQRYKTLDGIHDMIHKLLVFLKVT